MKSERHILATRLLRQDLLDAAADQHIRIHCIPFIETSTIQSEALRLQLNHYATLPLITLFSSSNAVGATFGYLDRTPDWKAFALSGATREELLRYLPPDHIWATGIHAGALALQISNWKEAIDKVVFFCGDRRRDELPDYLAAQGIRVEELTVYRTRETPVTYREAIDGILFFSPSAVHSYFSRNSLPDQTVVFSIGRTTTQTIHQYCNHPVITSDLPTQEHMLQLVHQYPW